MHLPEYRKAILETRRVARRFCVFHSVPVRSTGPAIFLTKKAYRVPVAEVIVDQAEFEEVVRTEGLLTRHILESLPSKIDNIADDIDTLTYVCEKTT